jgi:hypothetical protein
MSTADDIREIRDRVADIGETVGQLVGRVDALAERGRMGEQCMRLGFEALKLFGEVAQDALKPGTLKWLAGTAAVVVAIWRGGEPAVQRILDWALPVAQAHVSVGP